MEKLFAYGTLQDKDIQENIFGRILRGTSEILVGYVLKKIQIEEKEYTESKIKPWDDYNSKISIFDIISDTFEVVRNIKDKYIIRRFNATSAHSGYVYKNSGCMYLFSTGTIYPNEKLIVSRAGFSAISPCGSPIIERPSVSSAASLVSTRI